MTRESLYWGDYKLEFDVVCSNRKTLTIKVYPDNRIELLAPINATREQVLDKVRSKSSWILKQISYFNSFKPGTPPRRFVNGESHLYLGRQYKLKVVLGNEQAINVYRGQLWMYTINSCPDALKEQLSNWYKQKAIIVFHDLLKKLLPRFSRYKIKRPDLMIRHMSKRWGSCTQAGKIILNAELIKAPKGCIEYVVIHELAHLVHHNHTTAFQQLLSRVMPDWKKWKDRLEHTLK